MNMGRPFWEVQPSEKQHAGDGPGMRLPHDPSLPRLPRVEMNLCFAEEDKKIQFYPCGRRRGQAPSKKGACPHAPHPRPVPPGDFSGVFFFLVILTCYPCLNRRIPTSFPCARTRILSSRKVMVAKIGKRNFHLLEFVGENVSNRRNGQIVLTPHFSLIILTNQKTELCQVAHGGVGWHDTS